MLLWSGVGGQLVTSSSAALLSSLSQQPFSAALLSSPPFSAALLSSSSQQLFSAALLSSSSQQLFSAALLSYHLAVVRGWWSSMLPFFRRTLSQRFREKNLCKSVLEGCGIVWLRTLGLILPPQNKSQSRTNKVNF